MEFEIKIAICDDDFIYRERTEEACRNFFAEKRGERYLARIQDISAFSAGRELIASDKDYDVLFLDIEMPDQDGISVKEYFEMHRKQTQIIFITSHQERVIEAFGKNVVSFLVKPFNTEDIWKVLEKTISDICDDILEIEENGEMLLIPVKQIKYIEAQDKYTAAVTETERYLLRKTMKFWEEILPEQDFCRIHKSYLMNLEYLEKRGDEVLLDNGRTVKMSRLKKKEVIEKYKEFLRRKVRMM